MIKKNNIDDKKNDERNSNRSAEKAAFFRHEECEYFPCHETPDPEQFNCLFCYCPLYTLGSNCGGNFSYTQSGIKDCKNCILPHQPGGREQILSKFPELSKLANAQ